MTNYQEITRQVGDQWVAALKNAEQTLVKLATNLSENKDKYDVPQIPTPEVIEKLNEAVAERLPKPSEVVEANFELTNRLLAAQRDLTLRLLEVSGSKAKTAKA